jgi:hypothetical protein
MSETLDYETVVSNGEVIKKQGRHSKSSKCDCDFDAPLGNYRDVEVLFEGKHIVFYHSTPIVVDYPDGGYRLSNGGWETKSTKERINRHMPSGYKLVQRDCDWYIQHDDSLTEFRSDMEIEP